MTPRQAKRRAARRIRRRRRRAIFRALLILPMILVAAVLAADVVEVRRDSPKVVPLPRAPRAAPRPSRLPVPVPVFRPSILLDSLEVEIPMLDPLDIQLLDSKIERSLAERRIAQAKERQKSQKQPDPPEQRVPKEVAAELIQVSGVSPHLLEIIPPRPFVDPEAVVAELEMLPLLDPWGPLGWPGVGWIDFPLNPDGDIELVQPLPTAKKKKKDDEEEKQPPVIPEPGTATLLALGLAALGIARRRSSRSRLV